MSFFSVTIRGRLLRDLTVTRCQWNFFMPALSNNIENRVQKLPKPSSAAQGLQPLFEAVSNSAYAIEDRLKENASNGNLVIRVTNLSDPEKLEIVVVDDGIGLDADRYGAFCQVDTDFKRSKGGKGVGRLFWLDAFKEIVVESVYTLSKNSARRKFKFLLNNIEQVKPQFENQPAHGAPTGTVVTFRSLRISDYADHFPKRAETFSALFQRSLHCRFSSGEGAKNMGRS
jgi:hypothetical protein